MGLTNEHGCLACPFWGNTDIQPQRLQITPRCRPDSAVICRHCDAVGPWANTPELAVKIWNEGFTLRRPASYRAKQKIANFRYPPCTDALRSNQCTGRRVAPTCFSRSARKCSTMIWSRPLGYGTLRSGVLLDHPRLLSGFPFAGAPCSG
jgi:hypothetical protein